MDLFEIETWHRTRIVVDLASGQLQHGQPVAGQIGRVVAWFPASRPSCCLLFAPPDAAVPLLLIHDRDQAAIISLVAARTDDGLLTLRHPITRCYVCATEGPWVAADRTELGPWETFTTLPATDVPAEVAAAVRACETLFDRVRSVPDAIEALRSLKFLAPSSRAALVPLLRLFGPAEIDWLGRALGRDRAACDAFVALCPHDRWARDALPSLFALDDGTFERSIGTSLDELAVTGMPGGYVSLGHMCNAFARRDHAPRRDLALVTTARNEGLYLLEWLAYHRALGVERFFIYTNDNDDGSDDLLDALVQAGIICLLRNTTTPGVSPQYKAYGHAFQMLPELVDYRWAGVIDIDEFIVLDASRYRTIGAFIAEQDTRKADAIALSWMMFGANDHTARPPGPVTRRFTTREPAANVHVKSICRPQLFIHSHAHYPIWDEYTEFTFRDAGGGLHRKSREGYSSFSLTPGDRHAWINHYITKSAEEFILRRSVSQADLPLALAASPDLFDAAKIDLFMTRFNAPDMVVDRRAEACSPELEAGIDALRRLPGVDQAMRAIEHVYTDRLRRLDRMLAEDRRFQAPGTPESWFAGIVARAAVPVA